MTAFISGGCKNGKSFYAQRLARHWARGGPLFYIATMEPKDKEDLARVARHRKERDGWGFETLEWGRDLLGHWRREPRKGALLLDSVTALLANEMFGPEGTVNDKAGEIVAASLSTLEKEAEHVVFVSDYLYSDAALYDPLTEAYRKNLALVDRTLARQCDVVLEACAGLVLSHKGGLPL